MLHIPKFKDTFHVFYTISQNVCKQYPVFLFHFTALFILETQEFSSWASESERMSPPNYGRLSYLQLQNRLSSKWKRTQGSAMSVSTSLCLAACPLLPSTAGAPPALTAQTETALRPKHCSTDSAPQFWQPDPPQKYGSEIFAPQTATYQQCNLKTTVIRGLICRLAAYRIRNEAQSQNASQLAAVRALHLKLFFQHCRLSSHQYSYSTTAEHDSATCRNATNSSCFLITGFKTEDYTTIRSTGTQQEHFLNNLSCFKVFRFKNIKAAAP